MGALMTAGGWQRVARWLARLLMVAVIGLIFAAATVVTVLPRATHGAALTVLSGSMTPKLPVGSVVLIRPVDPGTLHVGDVATYQKEPGKAEYVTHRIVAIDTSTTPTTFTFKGDANNGPDIDPVPATAIRGKAWFSVPYLGAIRDAVHTKGMLFLLAIVALVGYALVQLASAVRDRRRKKTPAPRRTASSSEPAISSEFKPDDVTTDDAPASDNVTAGPRQVLVATFRAGRTGGLAPESVAWALGGVLLDQTADLFSVVVVGTAERLPMTVVLLETLEPLRIERFTLVSDTVLPETAARRVVDLDAAELVSVAEGHVEPS